MLLKNLPCIPNIAAARLFWRLSQDFQQPFLLSNVASGQAVHDKHACLAFLDVAANLAAAFSFCQVKDVISYLERRPGIAAELNYLFYKVVPACNNCCANNRQRHVMRGFAGYHSYIFL